MNDDIPVLERLRAELTDAVARQESLPGTRSPMRRRWLLGLAAAGLAAAVVLVSAVLASDRPVTPPDPRALGSPESPIGGGMGSCVEDFTVENLSRRGFAFDGVLRSIEVPPGVTDRPTLLTFEVAHWYTGGSGGTVELKTYEVPGAISSASLGQHDPVPLEVGQRVLGSGEDDLLWSCGFSMLYTPNNAALFAAAFED